MIFSNSEEDGDDDFIATVAYQALGVVKFNLIFHEYKRVSTA